MNTQHQTNSYKEIQIKTATPGKLIIMLYDGAIKHLNLAAEQIKLKHAGYEKASNSILKAQDIITELMVSLNFEKGDQIAKNLFSLYVYINKRLVEANIEKDGKILNELKKHLTELRDAWAEAAKKTQTDTDRSGSPSINIAG